MIGCLWMVPALASKESNHGPPMGYYLGGYHGVILRVSVADDKCQYLRDEMLNNRRYMISHPGLSVNYPRNVYFLFI